MGKQGTIPLSVGIKDTATAKAVKALEDQLRRNPSVQVDGSHASGDALKSLLAALEQLGLIADRTKP